MKRCPTCEKTFDDNLRFCQADGTPLVAVEAVVDPYKTMVARPADIAAAIPPAASAPASPRAESEDVLELPAQSDVNKTQVVSEAELRAEMAKADFREEPFMEVPPIAEPLPPEPPKFSEPSLSPPPFVEAGTPPPSPFVLNAEEPAASEPAASPFSGELKGDPFAHTTPPIPSPFSEKPTPPMAAATANEPVFPATPPPFAEPPAAEPFVSPFVNPPIEEKAMAQTDWTPPAAPEGSWQNQEMGQNAPPPAAGSGQNKTLPIVSLVFGILSLCCYVSPLTGIVALITGFMGMKNVNNDPSQYGGKTLAIVGMILGGLFGILGFAYWIFMLFFGGLGLMMDMMR